MKGIFKRNKIEENVAKQLMCGCSAKKITRLPFVGCVLF
jgi:hypothetical protein